MLGGGRAVAPDGAAAIATKVEPLGHLLIGVQAVIATRDAGDRQQLMEVLVVALAYVAGQARRLDVVFPLSDAGVDLRGGGRPRLVQTPTGAAAGGPRGLCAGGGQMVEFKRSRRRYGARWGIRTWNRRVFPS